MRKRLITIICSMTCFMAFSGCGGASGQIHLTEQKKAAEDISTVSVTKALDENKTSDVAIVQDVTKEFDANEYEKLEKRLTEKYENLQNELIADVVKQNLYLLYTAYHRNNPQLSDETYIALLDSRSQMGWYSADLHQEAVILGKESADARRITLEDVEKIIEDTAALSSKERGTAIMQGLNNIRSADKSISYFGNSYPKYWYYLDDNGSESILVVADTGSDDEAYVHIKYEQLNEDGTYKASKVLYDSKEDHP